MRLIENWTPNSKDLTPTEYRYAVPPEIRASRVGGCSDGHSDSARRSLPHESRACAEGRAACLGALRSQRHIRLHARFPNPLETHAFSHCGAATRNCHTAVGSTQGSRKQSRGLVGQKCQLTPKPTVRGLKVVATDAGTEKKNRLIVGRLSSALLAKSVTS